MAQAQRKLWLILSHETLNKDIFKCLIHNFYLWNEMSMSFAMLTLRYVLKCCEIKRLWVYSYIEFLKVFVYLSLHYFQCSKAEACTIQQIIHSLTVWSVNE